MNVKRKILQLRPVRNFLLHELKIDFLTQRFSAKKSNPKFVVVVVISSANY